MKTIEWVPEWVTEEMLSPRSRQGRWSLLARCAVVAFLFEVFFVTGISWREHWLAHPQKTVGLDEDRFIDAQVFRLPEEAHLVEDKKPTQVARKPEPVLSRVANQGKTAPSTPTPADEENQTDSGPKMAPTHGPVAVYAPSPVIPPHLQDRTFKTSVVIEFFVNSLGHATPRLVSSSGNEELDAIAIATAQKWQFRPAEKEHHPYDSHTRLRIVFEVN